MIEQKVESQMVKSNIDTFRHYSLIHSLPDVAPGGIRGNTIYLTITYQNEEFFSSYLASSGFF
jgi:hypothetical protein